MTCREEVKYMCPSEIRYMSSVHSSLPDQARLRDIDLTEYARRLAKHSGTYPRVQVIEAAGAFYATNHLNLALCRYLERAGYCREVRVTVCAAGNIPETLKRIISTETGESENSDSMVMADMLYSDSDQQNDETSSPGTGTTDSTCSLSYCSLCDKDHTSNNPHGNVHRTDEDDERNRLPAFSVPCELPPPGHYVPTTPCVLEHETECLL